MLGTAVQFRVTELKISTELNSVLLSGVPESPEPLPPTATMKVSLLFLATTKKSKKRIQKNELEREKETSQLNMISISSYVHGDSRAEMRFTAAESAENKTSFVSFIRTRAEESSVLVEESSDLVELSSVLVEESSDLVELSSVSALVTRTRAEERTDKRSDLVEESSVKFTMETNPP